jgi:uncharacterized protein HemX
MPDHTNGRHGESTTTGLGFFRQVKSPIVIGIAILAALGWGLAVYLAWSGAREARELREQLAQTTTEAAGLRQTLQSHQHATATLTEIENRLGARRTDLEAVEVQL